MWEKISLVYICDENYVLPTCVSIQSLYENKKKSKYEVYILGINLSEESKALIKNIKLRGVKIKLINFGNKYANVNANHSYVSKAALYKFDIPDILVKLKKVLYIDCDTLVMDDLSELFHTDISKVYAGVVKDFPAYYQAKDHERLGVDNYFNSGVMLLNLQKIRQDKVPQKLFDYKINKDSKKYMDQDCFNMIFGGNVKFLCLKNNYLTAGCDLYNKEYPEEIEPVIIHFASLHPWKNYLFRYAPEWDNYFKKSVCKDFKLERINEPEVVEEEIVEKENLLTKKKFIYKEKFENKRVIHIGKIKITYHKFLKKDFLDKISENVDLIVGIPPLGMVAAYMIGKKRNLKVVSVNEFLAENNYKLKKNSLIGDLKNVLVVDVHAKRKNERSIKNILKDYESSYNIKYINL